MTHAIIICVVVCEASSFRSICHNSEKQFWLAVSLALCLLNFFSFLPLYFLCWFVLSDFISVINNNTWFIQFGHKRCIDSMKINLKIAFECSFSIVHLLWPWLRFGNNDPWNLIFEFHSSHLIWPIEMCMLLGNC